MKMQNVSWWFVGLLVLVPIYSSNVVAIDCPAYFNEDWDDKLWCIWIRNNTSSHVEILNWGPSSGEADRNDDYWLSTRVFNDRMVLGAGEVKPLAAFDNDGWGGGFGKNVEFSGDLIIDGETVENTLQYKASIILGHLDDVEYRINGDTGWYDSPTGEFFYVNGKNYLLAVSDKWDTSRATFEGFFSINDPQGNAGHIPNDYADDVDRINVMNYNTFLTYSDQAGKPDYCWRANQIYVDRLEIFENVDILVLNELMSRDACTPDARQLAVEEFLCCGPDKPFRDRTSLLNGEPAVVGIAGPTDTGGVIVMSRYPDSLSIGTKREIDYEQEDSLNDYSDEDEVHYEYRKSQSQCLGEDCLADKGYLKVKFTKTVNDESKDYYIIATHAQADPGAEEAEVRKQQFIAMEKMAASLPADTPIIYVGDLNIEPSEYESTETALKIAQIPNAYEPWEYDGVVSAVMDGLLYSNDTATNYYAHDDADKGFAKAYDWVLPYTEGELPKHMRLTTVPIRDIHYRGDLSDHHAVIGDLDFSPPSYEELVAECEKFVAQGLWTKSCEVPAIRRSQLLAEDCACIGRKMQHKGSGLYQCEAHGGTCGGVSFIDIYGQGPDMNEYRIIENTSKFSHQDLVTDCATSVDAGSWTETCDLPAVSNLQMLTGDCACSGRTLQHKETGLYRCEAHALACGGTSFLGTLGEQPDMDEYTQVANTQLYNGSDLLSECAQNVSDGRWPESESCDIPAVRTMAFLMGDCACVGRTLKHNDTGLYRCEAHKSSCLTSISFQFTLHEHPDMTEYTEIANASYRYDDLVQVCEQNAESRGWSYPCTVPAVIDPRYLTGDCECVGDTLTDNDTLLHLCEAHNSACGGASVVGAYGVVPDSAYIGNEDSTKPFMSVATNSVFEYDDLVDDCQANVDAGLWQESCELPAVSDPKLLTGKCACQGRMLAHNPTRLYRCETLGNSCGGVGFQQTLGVEPNMSCYTEMPLGGIGDQPIPIAGSVLQAELAPDTMFTTGSDRDGNDKVTDYQGATIDVAAPASLSVIGHLEFDLGGLVGQPMHSATLEFSLITNNHNHHTRPPLDHTRAFDVYIYGGDGVVAASDHALDHQIKIDTVSYHNGEAGAKSFSMDLTAAQLCSVIHGSTTHLGISIVGLATHEGDWGPSKIFPPSRLDITYVD